MRPLHRSGRPAPGRQLPALVRTLAAGNAPCLLSRPRAPQRHPLGRGLRPGAEAEGEGAPHPRDKARAGRSRTAVGGRPDGGAPCRGGQAETEAAPPAGGHAEVHQRGQREMQTGNRGAAPPAPPRVGR